MQHKHEHEGEVKVNTDIVEEIGKVKEHFRRNKRIYLEVAAGIGVASISWIIIRGSYAGVLSVPESSVPSVLDGPVKVTVSPRFLFSDKNRIVVSTVLERRGHPGWIVRCKETGELFASQNRAADVAGISAGTLSDHLNGLRDHAGGFHFERIGEAV